MAVSTVLLGFLVLAGVVFGAIALVGFLKNADRTKVRELTTELSMERSISRTAIKALRNVRNDAGNPILEAQIALDEIESVQDSYNAKELY